MNRRFIFTVTTGRSGSNFLTEVLSCLSDTYSTHEPEPRYDVVMRMVQDYPAVAEEFLRKKKIPEILKRLNGRSIYVESSHLVCKGFIEPWLNMGGVVTPDIICLDRDSRKVSLSLYQIGTIPGRSWKGLQFYLSPKDPSNLTKLIDYENLHDYQLCYWYCLEIEARKKYYKNLIESQGGTCVHTSIEKLKNIDGVLTLREELNLPNFSYFGKMRYKRLSQKIINPKSKRKNLLDLSEEDLDMMEKEVQSRVYL